MTQADWIHEAIMWSILLLALLAAIPLWAYLHANSK
jgi:hypothetical protein